MLAVLIALIFLTKESSSTGLVEQNTEIYKRQDYKFEGNVNINRRPDAKTHYIIDCYRCCVGAFSLEKSRKMCPQHENLNNGKNCKCEKAEALED